MAAAEVWKFAPAYELPSWPFVPPADLGARARKRYPVVIAGGGLSGLTLACDLLLRGVAVIVLDEDDTVGVRGASSRGICYAQKSLEIFARLGIYERIRAKGITWSVGRTFSGADEIYSFNLDDESRSEQPPFINLQQFYLEWFLVDRIRELDPSAIRWKSKVTAVEHGAAGAVVEVETPAGAYALEADWFVDATGANSRIREALGLEAHASRHTDRWCISDVRFRKPLPVERWTWIDAPFNEGRGVWQHLMADEVWRLDYQMDEHADPESISKPEVAGRAPARAARPRRRVRVRLDRPVPVPRPPARDVPRRPHDLRRRRRARRLPVRRARRQQRHPGRGEPRLEARARRPRPGGRGARRQLPRRAPRGGGREPARDEPHRALPRAAQRRRAPDAARRRRARAHARVRAQARQHRPHGAGQRLSAVALGVRGRALAAERRIEGTTVMRLLARRHALRRAVDRRRRRGDRVARRRRAAAAVRCLRGRQATVRSPGCSAFRPEPSSSSVPMPTSRRRLRRRLPIASRRRCAAPSAIGDDQ
jgi:2-polyprenyl-6-methoxyphenol hydroxylase-like FAD-dependent oxidoreductase